jgi:hypothetical protein
MVDAEDYEDTITDGVVTELMDCETDAAKFHKWQIISEIRPYLWQKVGSVGSATEEVMPADSDAIKRAGVMMRIEGTNRKASVLQYRLTFPQKGTVRVFGRSLHSRMPLVPNACSLEALACV